MKVYIISDEDYKNELYKNLSEQVCTFFSKKKFEIYEKSICKNELHFCMGCYGCWTKKPGECVINDSMSQINSTFNNSDVVIYLSPIIFGQYSPNIKTVIDRWLPNVLPLFVKKQDGTTGHPDRYSSKPKMVIIGYSNEISAEEAALFKRVVKHRNDVDVIVFSNSQKDFSLDLNKIKMERIEK